MKKKPAQQGQVLLELLVAVGVFTLTIYYFIMTLSNILLMKGRYRDMVTASYIVQE
jgi:hypothetical protein